VPYVVTLTREAQKGLTKLPRSVQPRVAAKLRGLIEEPRPDGVKKLKGAESIYRLRVGNFRILYEVEDGALLVLVIRLGDRKGQSSHTDRWSTLVFWSTSVMGLRVSHRAT
jgi:mRNA interferase RelE/StbE